MIALPVRHQFTVDDLQKMIVAGVIAEETRVELIEGDLIDMRPINESHADTVDSFVDLLVLQIGQRAKVRFGNPV